MPRRRGLAVLFSVLAAGVGACGPGVAPDTDASADGLDAGPRPRFGSYVETLSYYDVTLGKILSSTPVSIDATGSVCGGHATDAELATFVEVATRPSTVAAFMSTTLCSAIGDGADDLSLVLDDHAPLTRSVNCDGVTPIRQAAMILQTSVCARVHAGAP
jgi:hypothetical protein